MIVREIVKDPDQVIRTFDHFNDFSDTHRWLLSTKRPELAERLAKAHEDYHKALYASRKK